MPVNPEKPPTRSGQRKKPFQPAVGTDYGAVKEVEAKTRGFFTRAIISAGIVGLAVAGGYSLITGNYMVVIAVWGVVGPIIGAMTSYFFGPQRNDTG